jgi:FKBP-type peptidyl-prolyl cis-trans isomerase 2
VAAVVLLFGILIVTGCSKEDNQDVAQNSLTIAPQSTVIPSNSTPIVTSTDTLKEGQEVAKKGDKVAVHYTGTLSDGTQFDSSEGRAPLEFTVGAGQMIAGFDKAVDGMKVGETKTVTIPAAEAYGTVRPELVMEFPKSSLPQGMNPKVGEQLQMRNSSGGTAIVTVTRVTDSSITVDANHELAGKDLTFKIRLVEIKK